MSIVRYKNKKTGVVAVYESTSHYDPVTKSSRPSRKYLGTENPITGELIPSSGKRGRKKGDAPSRSVEEYLTRINELSDALRKSESRLAELEQENSRLRTVVTELDRILKEGTGLTSSLGIQR